MLRPAMFGRTHVVARRKAKEPQEFCDAVVRSICLRGPRHEVAVNPIFTRAAIRVSRNSMPDGELDADTSYQLVQDELMLDG